MTFDLHDLFREVHDTTDLTDYRQMAKELRSRIPDEHAEEAFLEALTCYCREYTTKQRPRNPSPSRASGRSPKRDAIRHWWEQLCKSRYDTADGLKQLGTCSAEDLIFMAEQLERKAAENMAVAQRWRSLAAEMAERGAARLDELPPDVVRERFGGAQ